MQQKISKEDIINLFKLSKQDSSAQNKLIRLGQEACEILEHDAALKAGVGKENTKNSMPLIDSSSFQNLEAVIYGLTTAHELLSREQKSVRSFQHSADQQFHDNNFIQYSLADGSMGGEGIDYLLKYNLGLAILISILLDPFVGENKENRKKAIEGILSANYIGTKIIKKITADIPRNFYPDFIYKLDINDIIDLISNVTTKDDPDDFCHILDAINKKGIEGLKITPCNVTNIKNFLNVSKKNFSPAQKDYLKDVTVTRVAIIAGVLAAGRGKIAGIKTLENTQEETGQIASVRASSAGMIKKYCYEKSYSEDGNKIRVLTQETMKRMFDKLDKDVNLVKPSAMECFMVAFLSLWNLDYVWTGSKLPDEIPQLRLV